MSWAATRLRTRIRAVTVPDSPEVEQVQVKYGGPPPEVVRHRVKLRPAFTGVSAPRYNGDDDVRRANAELARDARKAMREFRKSLPKGVKI
jgi:hypothetical protein